VDDAQKQVAEALKGASNILVTVSTDPSVDGLSAALGLTLLLDKLDKRATAIFSGAIPPAINFLEPAKTFESTADSLRDFIIALNKEKADHLRYKVDGDVVKIFITPYKTTLTEGDLEFSQGDYNVELVVALGVTSQDNLDKALDAHGKILHDAKVVTITAGETASNLGGVDWNDKESSSLSEMVVTLSGLIGDGGKLLDEQIATALLTGIVSATDRFSNDHTSSRVMTMAAQLMAAGANQQLIAAKLEEGHDIAPEKAVDIIQEPTIPIAKDDGTELSIERNTVIPSIDPAVGGNEGTELVVDKDEDSQNIETLPLAESSSTADRQPQPTLSAEESNQVELEKGLASIITPSPTATLADIEKEFRQEPTVTNSAVDPDPLTASNEATMPGFEATGPIQPEVLQAESTPESQPMTPDVSPQIPEPAVVPIPVTEPDPGIITDHGSRTMVFPEQPPPINGALESDMTGDVVNPFDIPQMSHTGIAVAPVQAGIEGNPEGTAALVMPPESVPVIAPPTPDPLQSPMLPSEPQIEQNPTVSSVAPPIVTAEVPELPPLPPLPPLSSDGSVPPLPPPPPVFGGQVGVMPSGAVSGDIFGDMGGPTPPPSTPTEPGVFKIPGQP